MKLIVTISNSNTMYMNRLWGYGSLRHHSKLVFWFSGNQPKIDPLFYSVRWLPKEHFRTIPVRTSYTKINLWTTTILKRPICGESNHSSVTEIKSSSIIRSTWVGKFSPFSIISAYLELSKAKLASLIVLTSMVGYAMAPGTASISDDLVKLLVTTIGTTLSVASANAINQWIEAPYDAQMDRTRNRILVRGAIDPAHALSFGLISGLLGSTLLYTQVNMLTAFLGVSNILLYTMVYTPLKRMSIFNTWVGAVVGALPPLMGWAACTNSLSPGAALIGALLYAWQFPHFCSLSWGLREDYRKAGYHMMCVLTPRLNSRVALRYSLYMVPLCLCTSMVGLTSYWFIFDSSLINLILIRYAYQFHRNCDNSTAKKLFFMSLIHLPILLTLLLVHKRQPIPNES